MTRTLRFCSWNIQVGMRRAVLLEAVRSHPAFHNLDVLALQEASRHVERDDAQLIAEVLGADYAHVQHVYHHLGSYAQANALVWNCARVQMDQIDRVHLPGRRDVPIARWERALLISQRQSRVNLVADGVWDSIRLRVCSAHLDVIGFRFKHAQFRSILNDLQARPRVELTVLAGDFNTFSLGGYPDWSRLKSAAEDIGMKSITDDIEWTHEVRRLGFRQKLDEIFVGTQLPLDADVWTLRVDGSDHLPVFADLHLP